MQTFIPKLRTMAGLHVTIYFALAMTLCNCSSSSEEGVNEEVNANGGSNGEAVNSADAGDGGAIDQANASSGGEQINNVSDNEFADDSTGGNSLNLGNTGNMTAPANGAALANDTAAPTNTATESTNSTLLPSNIATPTNTTAADPLAGAAPTNAAAALPATDPAAATPLTPPTGVGTVKYVKSTTPIADQPGGPAVGNLEQGDHPVVWDDGQNAKLATGKLVPSTALSDKGIGRPRNVVTWRSGGE